MIAPQGIHSENNLSDERWRFTSGVELRYSPQIQAGKEKHNWICRARSTPCGQVFGAAFVSWSNFGRLGSPQKKSQTKQRQLTSSFYVCLYLCWLIERKNRKIEKNPPLILATEVGKNASASITEAKTTLLRASIDRRAERRVCLRLLCASVFFRWCCWGNFETDGERNAERYSATVQALIHVFCFDMRPNRRRDILVLRVRLKKMIS